MIETLEQSQKQEMPKPKEFFKPKLAALYKCKQNRCWIVFSKQFFTRR